MIRPLVFLGALAASLLLCPGVHACAGCSNPNLPAGRSGEITLRPAEVSASFHLTGTTMNVVHSEHCPDIGPICQQRAEPGQLHDQDFYVGELRPIVEVGITEVLGIEAQLPFRITRTTIVFRRLDGTPFVPDYENIHHRNETLVGFADPWLSGRGAWKLGILGLVAKAGVTLPLGRTEPDPFARGRAGLRHQHIQFGTGTFNPVIGVDIAQPLGKQLRLNAYGQTLLFLYGNRYGYRAGNRYLGGAAVEATFVPQLVLSVGADLLNEQPERWSGQVQQDGNVGRTDLLVGGTIGYRLGRTTVALAVKAPVWQHFIVAGHRHNGDPGQLRYPAIVNLSVQRTFGAR
jgi:hypothetical protein